MTPRHVVVDANVFLSFLVERNEKQRQAAKALLVSADQGDIAAVVAQFVVFEMTCAMQNSYGIAPREVATIVRELMAFPGVIAIDDCPWKKVFEYWPDRLASIGDAAIVAVAITNRYDAVATFDQKMVKRMKAMGVESYW